MSVVHVKNLQKKTSNSMLLIALRQMIFGALALGLGWVCFEAAPIKRIVPLMGAILCKGVPGSGLAWMLFHYA